ncbi:MAG: hypothetical protein JNM81_08790 [Rhodospirillaceae bacterium]|nr:hypothetical protein [Rhodospirillaceae bacterium]
MKLTAIMWAALTIVVGVSLFMLKYKVQGLEDQLQATYVQIEKDRTAIRVLDAEWTYLNDPGRLRRLSEQYLGFAPPAASQVITISQLPFKNGEVPMLEGVSTPQPTQQPGELPLTGLREARAPEAQAPTAFGVQRAAFEEAPEESAFSSSIARLQRLLPANWTVRTVNAPMLSAPMLSAPMLQETLR